MNKEKKQDSVINISDEEFIESFTSKKRRRKQENILDLNYLSEEVKTVFIYPLTTLTGKPTALEIQISSEKTTIMVTSPDKGQKVKVYLEETLPYDLNEFVDPTNPTEQVIKNTKDLNLTTLNFKNVNFNLLYLLTFEKISETNFEDLKKYLGKTIIPNIETGQCDMTFVPLQEFSSSFKSQPIKIILSKPITEKIKEIHIKSPIGALIGNIKTFSKNKETKQINLLAKENTEIFPKLVFPFQVQPHLATIEYWASKQIIPLYEIFEFLDSKDISYDKEFSLADFLKIGEDTEKVAENYFNNIEKFSYKLKGYAREEGTWNYVFDPTIPGKIWKYSPGQLTDKIVESYEKKSAWNDAANSNFNYGKSVAPDGKTTAYISAKTFEISSMKITELNVSKGSKGFEQICWMLTESFWKDMEFKGATKIETRDNQQIETIDDPEIYKLNQKYSGQDRYAVTTNIWISWKRANKNLVNANPEVFKRIENCLAMLSGEIKSNYSINKGNNDDYKILLPYYFELQNKLADPIKFDYYSDIKVKLKSNYGIFTDKGFNFTNKNISKSNIFELEYNHFAFPELTKQIETSSIPSSMPLDQELANGEYSKYMMLNFATDIAKKELYLKRYGSGNMQYDPISSSLNNEGEFHLETPSKIDELELSAFYGDGNWEIKFITETNIESKLNINLFNKNLDNQSLVKLII